MKCETCKYSSPISTDPEFKHCRRHAATLHPTYKVYRWPMVKFDDWCGEYEPLIRADENHFLYEGQLYAEPKREPRKKDTGSIKNLLMQAATLALIYERNNMHPGASAIADQIMKPDFCPKCGEDIHPNIPCNEAS